MSEENALISAVDEVAPEGWKKKVASLLFQLGLGTRKTAALYASGRETLDTVEGRSLVNRALAQAVAQQAIADPEMMERAKARFLDKMMTEQANLEGVIQQAGLLLTQQPDASREGDLMDEAENDSSDEVKALNEDWAAAFTKQAEQAGSSEMRERLARILAGEVLTPGKYPRSIFRTLIELEKEDIEAVQSVAAYKFDNVIICGLDPDGEGERKLRILSDAGLIDHARLPPPSLPSQVINDLRVMLVPRGEIGLYMQSQDFIKVDNMGVLSRAGVAAVDLVTKDNIESLRKLGAALRDAGRRAWIVGVESVAEGNYRIKPRELLYNDIPPDIPIML